MNTEFCKAKAKGGSGMSREEKLKSLASAYDMFMELKSNLEEGTKVRIKGGGGGGSFKV